MDQQAIEPINKNFDLEKEYDEQVEPLLDALHQKCSELGLPMTIAICYSNSEDGTGVARATHMHGRRTPTPFHAADAILDNEVPPELTMAVLQVWRAHKDGTLGGVTVVREEAPTPKQPLC